MDLSVPIAAALIGLISSKVRRIGWVCGKCVDCREQFTVTVGTPFERSEVPLSKWLMVAYLLCSSRKGISARQLQRTLGVTYKTAWRMAHRILEAMLHQNPSRLLAALWLQWILLGEQRRRNQEGVVVTEKCRKGSEAANAFDALSVIRNLGILFARTAAIAR